MRENDENAPELNWRATDLRKLLLGGGLVFVAVDLLAISNWFVGRLTLELVVIVGAISVTWLASGLMPIRRVLPRLFLPGLSTLAGILFSFTVVGFAGGPVIGCLALVVLSAAFTSRAIAIATGLLIAGLVAGMGGLIEGGVLTVQPMNPFATADAESWVRLGLVSTFLLALVVATLDWLLHRLTDQFAEETRAARALVREQRLREHADRSRAQAEKALAMSKDAEAIGRLAGGIAHDFNNQLQVFMSWTELVAASKGDKRAELIDEALEDIGRAARQSAELSRQLSSMSSAQTQSPGATDLHALLQKQMNTFRRVLPEDIALVRDCPEGLFPNLNEGKMHQILLNLVLNARDAMPAGGELRVEARLVAHTEVPERKASQDASPWVELGVSDSGVGIAEATLGRIFEPFFTTKGEGGTGLGLANVYGIVSAAGGKLRVETRLGEGTTFRVYLPTVEKLGPVAEIDTAAGGSGRILLVDDREDVREVLAETLGEAGYEVEVAADADAGIDALERMPGGVDLLVTDAIMPGRSVLDLIEVYQLRFPEGATLICSGHVEEVLLRRGIRSGDYAFMGKPFETAEFLQKVSALIAGSVESPLSAGTEADR